MANCVKTLHEMMIINLGIRPSKVGVFKKGKKYECKLLLLNEALILEKFQNEHSFKIKGSCFFIQ